VQLLRAQKCAAAALAAIAEATARWLEEKDFSEGALIGALAADGGGEPLVRGAVAAAQARMRAAFAALLTAQGVGEVAAQAKAALALAALDGAIAQARAARDAGILRRAIAALAL
jgi:TetR/AcrR family transcriptional repressor of lmrAB and yxaGH operons